MRLCLSCALQVDQPGIIAACAALLSEAGVNVSFMTVCRPGNRGEQAIMAIGIDEEPPREVLDALLCPFLSSLF